MSKIHKKQVKFKEMLLSTKREGMEKVIERLEVLGFFKAPASTKFNLNYEGGLLEHSMNMCDMALELREQIIRKKEGLHDSLSKESVIIAALLHDVCKADIYKPAIKRQKNERGVWCDVPGYDVDNSNFPLGHDETYVILLLHNGLKLTVDEIVAIHTMAQRVRGRKDSYLESWADIYLMYDYLAYGMSYFNAIVGLYEASPELSDYTIKDMISMCDSLHEAFVSDGCKDLKSLSDFAFISIHNMQLFYTLNGNTQNSDFEDPNFGFSLQCMLAVDSLCMTEQFSDIEVYQAYCFLESSAFFKMIFPLMRLFDKPSGLATENQPLVIEIASYFDEKTIPVMNYFSEGTKIQFLSNADFEEYMLQATKYKAALLRIVTQEMLAMSVNSSE